MNHDRTDWVHNILETLFWIAAIATITGFFWYIPDWIEARFCGTMFTFWAIQFWYDDMRKHEGH